MEKKDRILLGDIFCVGIDKTFKSYFQYITRDSTQLSSQVIRVFAHHYPMDSEPTMEEIVRDKVAFYAHTIIKVGIAYDAWYKVGKSKELGDTQELMFRQNSSATNWRIWKINTPFVFVGTLSEIEKKYDIGIVLSYMNICEKIRTGHFLNEQLRFW